MKPILIGQAPGPKTDPTKPLDPNTETGRRLVKLTGLEPVTFGYAFDLANLLHEFPGKCREGVPDRFPLCNAYVAAAAVKPFLRSRTVVCLGRGVAQSFGYSDKSRFHEWFVDPQYNFKVAIVPHTSGRNRWYQKPENAQESVAFWSKLTEEFKREPHCPRCGAGAFFRFKSTKQSICVECKLTIKH
jgi:uracil-DNA glycosylase